MNNSYQYSGSFDDFLNLTIQHAREKQIDYQIIEILKEFFEKELGKENRPFSRAQRKSLFQHVTKAILTDVLDKTGDTNK